MHGATDTAIGVDVGGTQIRVARIDATGGLCGRVAEPVLPDRNGFCAQLLRLIETVRHDACTGVGIGIPGRVDAANAAILSAGYLDVAGLDLPDLVERCIGLPARVENDATMALLAEARARATTPRVVAMLTIGTGIGGALLCDGVPWYGSGFSGQFGHLVVAGDGPLCNCGRHGCVETFSSGTALRRLVATAGLPPETRAEDLLARAATGDSVCARLLDAWARPFHRALGTLAAAVDPGLILVGGGLGTAMIGALTRVPPDSAWFRMPVEAAVLGNDAGVIGAGLRCFQDPA